MMRRGLGLAGLFLLSGCGPSVEDLMAEITAAEISQDLRDPASLELTETMVEISGGSGAVCGYMNAANAYGGMAGRERFVRVFDPDDMKTLKSMTGQSDQDREMRWRVHQNYRKLQRGELAVPRSNGADKTPGLFLESEEPITALNMTTSYCARNARPIELRR